jgi:outer membrane protein TolC
MKNEGPYMKPGIFLIFLSVLCASAIAQTRPLSLNEAIAASLQNNYDIQLTRNDSLLTALDYAYANYSLLPRLNASGAYIKNNNNQIQTLADGTKRERNGIKSTNLNASLNLNWTLFDGFRMFIARDRLSRLVELSELQIKAQVVTTVADVARIYYDIVRQEQLLRSIREQMDLSEERLKLAQYKFDIGTGAKPDMLQAQIDLNAQRASYLNQEVAINKLKEQLNQLLVMPVSYEFTVADTSITFNENLTLDSITGVVATTNPDLLIAQRNLTLAELDLRLRRAERFPVVEFNSAYNFSRTNNNTVINQFQPLFNQNKGLNYGLSVNIPIFNGLNANRLARAAEINIQSQQLLYDRTRALLNTSIINAYQDYDLYKRSLALEAENIALVRENLFIARERYRLGVTTFIELREAQQSLADANFRLINARYNTKVAEIELLRLRGDLVR